MLWLVTPATNRTGIHWQTWVTAIVLFVAVSPAATAETASAIAGVYLSLLLIIQGKAETRRESLSERWFWAVIVLLAVVHAVALWYIPIPDVEFGMMLAPFVFADFYAMSWLVNWVERRWAGTGAASEAEGPDGV